MRTHLSSCQLPPGIPAQHSVLPSAWAKMNDLRLWDTTGQECSLTDRLDPTPFSGWVSCVHLFCLDQSPNRMYQLSAQCPEVQLLFLCSLQGGVSSPRMGQMGRERGVIPRAGLGTTWCEQTAAWACGSRGSLSGGWHTGKGSVSLWPPLHG